MKIVDYVNDRFFKIIICNNLINILNYSMIISVSDNEIIIKGEYIVKIIGNGLNIIKLMDKEIIIKGFFTSICFGDL